MEIRGRTVLILGGSSLVGRAVARRLLHHEPRAIVVHALTQHEAEAALDELRREGAVPGGTDLHAVGGDLFLPVALGDRSFDEVLADPAARALFLDDLYGTAGDDPVARSKLGAILLEHEPEIVIDCADTAITVAAHDIFAAAARLREESRAGTADADGIERLLATLGLPRLIRYIEVAHEGMRRVGTRVYVKVGATGTGGMGFDTPFTDAVERNSRSILTTMGIAGAQTLSLFLMARNPGGPAIKVIMPTTVVGWKRIAYGEIRSGGCPVERYDATRAVPLDEAFDHAASSAFTATGGTLEGVFLDAGEHGHLSLGEFEALTSLGLMEFTTPEEIALDVEREILGHPTGKDIVAALEAATYGPSYRAGVLREVALERMEALERERGIYAVAYESFGTPRLAKLLFEAAILDRLFPDLPTAARLDPADTATAAAALIEEDTELRVRALSAGIPILLPDGKHLLRGSHIRLAPAAGQPPDDPRLRDHGWIDLTAGNWERWRTRLARIAAEIDAARRADIGSRLDLEPPSRASALRPGRLAAWVLRHEDQGGRIER